MLMFSHLLRCPAFFWVILTYLRNIFMLSLYDNKLQISIHFLKSNNNIWHYGKNNCSDRNDILSDLNPYFLRSTIFSPPKNHFKGGSVRNCVMFALKYLQQL